MGEVDLDALAAGYRHRRMSPAGLARAAAAADHAALRPGTVALDVGGGRGDHAAVFAGRGALSIVVDPSAEMAALAAGRPEVMVLRGRSDALPCRDRSCRLVYFHLSIHYGDWRRALAEAARTTAPGGSVWVWTFERSHFRASFLAQWFPSVPAIDERRFPRPSALAGALEASGWRDVGMEPAPERVGRTAGEWRAAVEAGFVSTLQILPPGELAEGLAAFDGAHPDPAEPMAYDLGFVAVFGRKASLA